MVVNDVLINHGGGGGASGSPCRGRLQGRTLSALGGTEDAAGAEAAVVALRWSNFERSECSSGLSAESAVKAPKEVRWGGHAQALTQGLEGDLLAFDLDRRQFEGGGSWGRQGESASRQIEMQGCFEGRADVVLAGLPCSAGNLPRSIGVSGWGTAAAHNGSHVGWGKDGKEPRLRVREDKYRSLKRRYSEGAHHPTYRRGRSSDRGNTDLEGCWGRLTGSYQSDGQAVRVGPCVLVRAQHADAAPGAVDNDASISGM
ncbi:predicted protein [Postia placenta Mad-698-R]|uniref:Uncharacterized protein n=1 Tax=Postia placenta MAD-698-R-SB12 TaxID=670580 RepID=A0A1X6MHS9_9APHY|nr:hypothetical protein POSPLADRAFT_1161828 [Postia placenta MAD-698-R-SB12]EED80849.1 predicted protein [Postia placenta Mad-698-R]OSX55971.1 hypothetical protein POSPLADRAFT_1161828 [Postia placenta MAD-698-R-SB12]